MSNVILDRQKRLRLKLSEMNFDCFLCARNSNVFYFTNHLETGDAMLFLLVPRDGEATLLVHEMNVDQAACEAQGCVVECFRMGEKPLARVTAALRELGVKNVAYDELPSGSLAAVSAALEGVLLERLEEAVWELRKAKGPEELSLLRKAAELASVGAQAALDSLKPGVHEFEVAAEAEYAMRKKGGHGAAFDTIVASGHRSAWPHGNAGNRRLEPGDVVVVDLGALFCGYRSDITRTGFVGPPGEAASAVYRIVYEAQAKALSRIQAGVDCRAVDAAARSIIADAGYGAFFPHGTGHGVGIDIHEPPRLTPTSEESLPLNAVVTVEPGIYLPRRFGVRIEDTVLVTPAGVEILTMCPKARL